jgi:hypothetical protein
LKRFSLILFVAAALTIGLAGGSTAQVIYPTPNWCSYADTLYASTFNGQPLAIGSIIQAYDPSGVYCGIDTVELDGGSGNPKFGYFPVYGDDSGTGELDEGATAGEQITFKINGRTATVTAGDDTWTNQDLKSVTLSASSTIAMSLVSAPDDTLLLPDRTVTFEVQVQNDGDGLDFYGVNLSMSASGGSPPFVWELIEPDTVVYAGVGEVATVYFSVYAPVMHADTANTITYSVFSHNDPTVTVDGTVDLHRTITDVNDPWVTLPGGFTLEQNYPNPFNPATTIAFNLEVGSTVRLDIINMLGQIVDSRNMGWLSAGPGQFEYDASDLTSGVYLYRLSTDTGGQARKMILLK